MLIRGGPTCVAHEPHVGRVFAARGCLRAHCTLCLLLTAFFCAACKATGAGAWDCEGACGSGWACQMCGEESECKSHGCNWRETSEPMDASKNVSCPSRATSKYECHAPTASSDSDGDGTDDSVDRDDDNDGIPDYADSSPFDSSKPCEYGASADGWFGSAVAFGDLGMGGTDLVMGAADGQLAWARCTSSDSKLSCVHVKVLQESMNSKNLTDLGDDFKWNPILGGQFGEGTYNYTGWREGAGHRYRLIAPAVTDVDGDSCNDIVFGNDGGCLRYLRGDCNDKPTSFHVPDMDPLLDICEREYVTVSDGFHKEIGPDVGGRSVPAFVDIDGDSDLDLVVGSNFGALGAYRRDELCTGTVCVPVYKLLEGYNLLEGTGGAEIPNPFIDIVVGKNTAPVFLPDMASALSLASCCAPACTGPHPTLRTAPLGSLHAGAAAWSRAQRLDTPSVARCGHAE